MQLAYFEAEKKNFIHNTKQVFLYLIQYVELSKCLALPHFQGVVERAKSILKLEDILAPAFYAAKTGKLEVLRFLIEECQFEGLVSFELASSSNKSTLLSHACEGGHLPIVDYLLEKGASTIWSNQHGNTPLHEAITHKHSHLVPSLRKHGAQLNTRNHYNQAPLHIAAFLRDIRSILALKAAKADMTLTWQDSDGKERNYDQLMRLVKEGHLSIMPMRSEEVPSRPMEIAIAAFFFALLQKNLNRQLFHEALKQFQALEIIPKPVVQLFLAAYILSSSTEEQALCKFITKPANTRKVEIQHWVDPILHTAMVLVEINANSDVQQLIDIALNVAHETLVDFDFRPLIKLCHGQSRTEKAIAIVKELLSKLPQGRERNKREAYLYVTLAYCYLETRQFGLQEAALAKAFDLINDDKVIFTSYLNVLTVQARYDTALQVCQASSCGELTNAATYIIKHKLGLITLDEFFTGTSGYQEDMTKSMLAIHWASYYFKKGNHRAAVSLINAMLPLSQFLIGGFMLTLLHLDSVLQLYLDNNEWDEAYQLLTMKRQEDPKEFEHNSNLQSTGILIYLHRNDIEEASKIANNLTTHNLLDNNVAESLVTLSEYYVTLNQLSAAKYYLDYILNRFPLYISALVVRFFVAVLERSSADYLSMKEKIDIDHLNSIVKTNNLTLKSTQSAEELDTYDPHKIHEYFQALKKQRESTLDPLSQTNFPDTHSSWVIDAKTYQIGAAHIVKLTSLFYPNHFAVIGDNILHKVDAQLLARFQTALDKGICKREAHQNGIKCLDGALFELKINGDLRLYTSVKYKNREGKYLIVFDKIGNHKEIEALLEHQRAIEIIETPSQKLSAQSESSSLFFQQSPNDTVSTASSTQSNDMALTGRATGRRE